MKKVLSLIFVLGLFHNGLLAQETSELSPVEQQELQRLLQERHAEIEAEKEARIKKRFDSIPDAIAVSPTNTEVRKTQIFEQEVARAEELLKASHTDEELKRLAKHSIQERDAAVRDSQMRGYVSSAVVGGTAAGLVIWALEDSKKPIDSAVAYVQKDSNVRRLQKEFSLLRTEQLAHQGDGLLSIKRQIKVLKETTPNREMLSLLPESVVSEFNEAHRAYKHASFSHWFNQDNSREFDAISKRFKKAEKALLKARKTRLSELEHVLRAMKSAGHNRAVYVSQQVEKLRKQLDNARNNAMTRYNNGHPKLIKKTRIGAKLVGAGLLLTLGNGLIAKWTADMDEPQLDEKLSLQNLRRHFSKEKTKITVESLNDL